ncbi:uncharacterized protein TNCV_2749751 [Trichonephila clavipes]|nr:uncharacterized protein TNCV_2749751 [Trichonephila clavipes]
MAALVSEYTLDFFTLLNARGKKELIEWCMKEGLIASSYECPKCNEQMGLNERKSVVLDELEWRCRKKVVNTHDVCRSIYSILISKTWPNIKSVLCGDILMNCSKQLILLKNSCGDWQDDCIISNFSGLAFVDCISKNLENESNMSRAVPAIQAKILPTASSAAIQAQVAPSLGTPVSSRTVRRRRTEGHLGSQHPLHVLPLSPTHRRLRLEWCRCNIVRVHYFVRGGFVGYRSRASSKHLSPHLPVGSLDSSGVKQGLRCIGSCTCGRRIYKETDTRCCCCFRDVTLQLSPSLMELFR